MSFHERGSEMFWKRKPKIERTACFWANEADCSAGFVSDAKELSRQGCPVLVLCHFSSTLEAAHHRLSAAGLPPVTLSAVDELDPRRIESLCSAGSVALIPFPLLSLRAPFHPAEGSTPVHGVLLVPDVHPTCSRDALVEQFAAGLPFRVSFRLYVSLEAPLMKVYGSDRLKFILQRLGLTEGQRLEHPLLTDTLRKAQQRLEAQVRQEITATSQKEWFKLNLPETQIEP